MYSCIPNSEFRSVFVIKAPTKSFFFVATWYPRCRRLSRLSVVSTPIYVSEASFDGEYRRTQAKQSECGGAHIRGVGDLVRGKDEGHEHDCRVKHIEQILQMREPVHDDLGCE